MREWKLSPNSNGLKLTLRYVLARNGSLSFVRVEKSLGNPTFDDSAIQAVRRASPFPSPPKSFPIGDLRMVLEPTRPMPANPVRNKLPRQQISAVHVGGPIFCCEKWSNDCQEAGEPYI